MSRDLTTCENRGTRIKSKVSGVEGIITGAYLGGFTVEVDGKPMMVPFKNIELFSVED